MFSSIEFGSILWCLCWPHGYYRGRFECSCLVDWQVCWSLSIVSSNAHQEHRTSSINGVHLTNNHLVEEAHRKRCWQREYVSPKQVTSLVIIIEWICITPVHLIYVQILFNVERRSSCSGCRNREKLQWYARVDTDIHFIYSNYGEWYKGMIDHRSYEHN